MGKPRPREGCRNTARRDIHISLRHRQDQNPDPSLTSRTKPLCTASCPSHRLDKKMKFHTLVSLLIRTDPPFLQPPPGPHAAYFHRAIISSSPCGQEKVLSPSLGLFQPSDTAAAISVILTKPCKLLGTYITPNTILLSL